MLSLFIVRALSLIFDSHVFITSHITALQEIMEATNPRPYPRTATPRTHPSKEQEECLPDPHSLPDPPPKYASPSSSNSHGLFAFGIINLNMMDQNQLDFINRTAHHEAVVHGWCRAL